MAQRCIKCSTLFEISDNKGTIESPICSDCFTEGETLVLEEFVEEEDDSVRRLKEKNEEYKKDNKFAKRVEGGIGFVLALCGGLLVLTSLGQGYFHIPSFLLFAAGLGAFLHAFASGALGSVGEDPLDDLLIEKGIDPTSISISAKLKRSSQTFEDAMHEMRKDMR